MPVFFEKPRLKAARVHADADGYISRAAGVGNGFDIVLAADVAGVYAYFIYAARGGLQREAVIKMYIRHERHIHLLLYRGHGARRRHIGYRDAHDVAPGGAQRFYLRHGRLHVPCLCVAHGLH